MNLSARGTPTSKLSTPVTECEQGLLGRPLGWKLGQQAFATGSLGTGQSKQGNSIGKGSEAWKIVGALMCLVWPQFLSPFYSVAVVWMLGVLAQGVPLSQAWSCWFSSWSLWAICSHPAVEVATSSSFPLTTSLCSLSLGFLISKTRQVDLLVSTLPSAWGGCLSPLWALSLLGCWRCPLVANIGHATQKWAWQSAWPSEWV